MPKWSRSRHVKLLPSDVRKQGDKKLPWWETIIRKDDPQSRSQYISPSGLITFNIPFPDAYRLQLQTVSSGIWFPERGIPALESAYEFMIRSFPRCPALAVALDASCLCHLGQDHENVSLWNAGRYYYGQALSLLRRELNSVIDRRNKALVAAICVLQVIEAFTSMRSGNDWLQHSQGLTALLDGFPDREAEQIGFSQLLSANFYLFHFWAGLYHRKRIVCFNTSGDGTVLVHIAERIPAALELVDTACVNKSSRSTEHIAQLIELLESLQRELKRWTMFWNPCMRSSPFKVVASEKLLHLDVLASKAIQNPIPQCMDFTRFQDALDHCVCTASLLSIQDAMLQINNTSKLLGDHQSARIQDFSHLTLSTESCAKSLCMAIPFFFKPEHGKYGYVAAAGPLYLVTQWYGKSYLNGVSPALENLRWCQAIAKHMEANGIRAL